MKIKKYLSITLLFLLFAWGCSDGSRETNDDVTDTTDQATMEEPDAEPTLTQVWETDTTLTTNESVLYDDATGRLYVSNIDGDPTGRDGKGFISILDQNGNIEQREWVTGLDAPKGMAIHNGTLYVTDIDELVSIDTETGTIKERYPVEGATFLNDVATDGSGIYFSDMNAGKIHVFQDGAVTLHAEGFPSVNGLAFHNGALHVLDANGLHNISNTSSPKTINSAVTGGDGLIIIDEETMIASKWQGEIYLIRNGEETLLLNSTDSLNTADIGYLPEENLVLVPRFFGNKVTAYRLDY